MATLENLDLRSVKQTTKDVVFGYIREAQKLFPSQEPFYIIPALIIHFSLLYYGDTDKFDKCGEDMNILSSDDGDDNILEMTNSSAWNTGYGSIIIDCNAKTNIIYEWHIDCKANTIGIGIDTSFATLHSFCFGTSNISSNYGYHDAGLKYCHSCDATEYDGSYRSGDKIIMRFDTKQKVLQFIINDKLVNNAYNNIVDGQYRLAVSLSGHYTVEITDFYAIYQ